MNIIKSAALLIALSLPIAAYAQSAGDDGSSKNTGTAPTADASAAGGAAGGSNGSSGTNGTATTTATETQLDSANPKGVTRCAKHQASTAKAEPGCKTTEQ
jgi:hypothetical protein